MEKLSEQELNIKITRFLEDRFAAHPEVSTASSDSSRLSERVVSRVKNITKKFATTSAGKNRTIYQS